MRPSSPILKVSGHSKRWLERQSRDPYVRQRVEFRSRSAFKLLEIDKKHPFLLASQPRVVVDLGAAPGGWSQVVALKLSQAKPQIIALDLNPIKPIPGVMTLQADFLSASGTRLLSSHIPPDANGQRKVDIILSDMAANATGNATTDHANSLRISEAVFEFAVHYLDIGGSLCVKFFQNPDAQSFAQNTLRPMFSNVKIVKPQSSRAESSESYWLCKGWTGGLKRPIV